MRRVRALFLCLAVACLCGCGAESPAAQANGEAEISEGVKYIALTFDDGPHAGTTDVLLDGLRERGAHGTFFLIGKEIAGHEELVRRMQAEGHQVGNHTWSHVRLSSSADIAAEVGETDALLQELLGEGVYWLRPPYGLAAAEAGSAIGVPMVKWSVDPRDWESRNTDRVVQAVLSAVQPNGIVLLHDIYPTSVDAALRIIDILQGEGYQFVTVEELLAANGVTPEPGILYCSGIG